MLWMPVNFAARALRLRWTIWLMAKRELVSRYVGTLGGPVWVIVQPLVTVAVYWLVFAVGFRAHTPSGVPFVYYFLSGYLPWLFFSEALNSGANSIVSKSYIVKKTIFPSDVLPLVCILSASILHLVLGLIFIAFLLAGGFGLSIFLPEILYFYACLLCLLLGLTLMLSSLYVFNRDVGQVLSVALNLWFWITPIAWSSDILPTKVQSILAWNPLFYIVEGYRSALVYHLPFWNDIDGAVRFWAVALPSLLVGGLVFQRLKPDFADAL